MGSTDYTLRILTHPAAEPVTVTEAKAHLVVEHTSDDALIKTLITAARQHVEARINGAVYRQKWRQTMDCFPCGDEIQLYKHPVRAIDQIQYVDTAGATQTLSASDYSLDRAAGRVLLDYDADWPSTRAQIGAVWVDMWCGYFNPDTSPWSHNNTDTSPITSSIPQGLRSAILLMVGDLYEHRELQSEMETYTNRTFDLLVGPYWMPHQ